MTKTELASEAHATSSRGNVAPSTFAKPTPPPSSGGALASST
jgi:hypothetical protein